ESGQGLPHLRGGAERGESGFDDGIEVDLSGVNVELLAEEGKALNKILNVVHAFGNGAQSILPELRVIPMVGKILEREIEDGGGVLEIVNEKGGDGLEGFHFARLEEALGELEVEQI